MGVDHQMMNVHALNPPANLIESSRKACDYSGFNYGWSEKETKSNLRSYWTTYKTRTIGLTFSPQTESMPNKRILNIGFQDHLYPYKWGEEEHYREFLDSSIELICRIAKICDADYMGLFTESEYNEVIPSDLPLADHIEKVPRVAVYSESLLQDFGGLSGLFNEPHWGWHRPPWRIGELDNGNLLVIAHEKPWIDGGWTESSYVDLRPGEEYL